MSYKRIVAPLLALVIAIALFGFARSGDDPIEKIISRLDQWMTDHPQEKVYLQLDKPYYAIGDDIWFKAYVTVGSDHKLSALSGALNVELIDDRDSIMQRVKLPLVSGLTWGDFTLPDTLKEGNYRIRAYTNWMRNAGTAYFFDKAITISNAITNDVFTHVTYSYSTESGHQKVNAQINYAKLDGTPLQNVAVSYRVQLGEKSVTRGNGETDGKGNLTIVFVNPTPDVLKGGRIITGLKLAGNKTVEKTLLIKATSAATDIQFFPEGGNLVNGNDSKIAVKAVGADGLGKAISGTVFDDQNNEAAVFKSNRLGMGEFELTPENGRTYHAKITYADGSSGMIDLPKATNSGYSLSIDNSDADVIHVRVLPGATVSASSSATAVMALVGQSAGQVYYAAKSKPGSKSFTADIPKSKFPGGIVQFTLFSPAGEPMNERLVFIENKNQLKLNATPDKQAYTPRQKATLNLEAEDSDGKPVIGSFSVSVTDESKVPVDENSENTILSNLLLTSDLKGYVEQPGYYFNNPSDKTRADLDLLMLTQGYHRFEWKQVLGDSPVADIYQPEKTLEISGRLKNLLGKPVVNGNVTLFSTKGGVFMTNTTSDDKGRFSFKNLIFEDSVRFVIQARTAKDHKNIQVDIDDIQTVPTSGNINAADFVVNINDGRASFLQNSKAQYDDLVKFGLASHSIVLKEVVIKEKKEQPLTSSSNLNGPGNADQVIRSGDLAGYGCPTIADCLQGRINGVVFRNDTPYLMRSLNQPMLIQLDGVNIDGETLSHINTSDIESIEVLKTIGYTSIYGGRGGGGVLVFTSKTGKSGGTYQHFSPGVVTYMPKGYAKVREFYSPRYDDPKTNSQVPDGRSTIFWKPNIITGKDGKASFDYFNADGKGIYRIVIEGIDDNGNLGRLVYHYKVE